MSAVRAGGLGASQPELIWLGDAGRFSRKEKAYGPTSRHPRETHRMAILRLVVQNGKGASAANARRRSSLRESIANRIAMRLHVCRARSRQFLGVTSKIPEPYSGICPNPSIAMTFPCICRKQRAGNRIVVNPNRTYFRTSASRMLSHVVSSIPDAKARIMISSRDLAVFSSLWAVSESVAGACRRCPQLPKVNWPAANQPPWHRPIQRRHIWQGAGMIARVL